jgi:quinol-cytochrome oxidoreductase complex cytochrome b subunit
MRTSLVGMSLALALVSLVAIGVVTYLFLSMGVAGISAAGIQLGSSLSPVQQLFGISLTSLAIVLVNVVFNVVVFREKR